MWDHANHGFYRVHLIIASELFYRENCVDLDAMVK